MKKSINVMDYARFRDELDNLLTNYMLPSWLMDTIDDMIKYLDIMETKEWIWSEEGPDDRFKALLGEDEE